MPPPFTYRELKAIQEGHRRNADVLDLLREIRRLRDLAALTYSILGYIPLNGLGEHMRKLEPLFDALNQEPAVQEYKLIRKRKEAIEFRRQRALQPKPSQQASEGSNGSGPDTQ